MPLTVQLELARKVLLTEDRRLDLITCASR
jgi:hypothetical protein